MVANKSKFHTKGSFKSQQSGNDDHKQTHLYFLKLLLFNLFNEIIKTFNYDFSRELVIVW